MADANMFSNPYFFAVFGIVIIIIIYKFFFKNRDKGLNLEEYKPQPIETTLEKELKGKIDIIGVPLKRGRLMLGTMEAGRIERYAIFNGKLPVYTYDKQTKQINIDPKEPEVEYEFVLIRCKSDSFIFRLFGTNKKYFMLKTEDVTFDVKGKRIFFPQGIDLMSWGDIWTNNELAAEYLTDISIKRMLLQTQSHVENMPDKIVVIETDTAKRERLAKTMTDLEKARYEKTKSADDTKTD